MLSQLQADKHSQQHTNDDDEDFHAAAHPFRFRPGNALTLLVARANSQPTFLGMFSVERPPQAACMALACALDFAGTAQSPFR